jgi:hypothetical protein
MEKKTIILAHETARRYAKRWVEVAPDGWVVRLAPPAKTRDQEDHYHGLIRHVSNYQPFAGRMRDFETWKRLLVDDFAHEKEMDGKPIIGHGEILPSLDGQRFIQLGAQTHLFGTPLAAEFITFLHAYGIEHGVPFWKRKR